MAGTGQLEAVRQAVEQFGEQASPEDIAAFVERTFGLKVLPAIVKVLLATLRERPTLESTRRKAIEAIERARAEQEAAGEVGAKKARGRRTRKPPEEVG